MIEPQIIEHEGKPAFAVVPIDEWRRIAAIVEDAEDAHTIEVIRSDPGRRMIPGEVVAAILHGQHPLQAWREFRGLTQRELAEAAKLAPGYVAQIESGRRQGTIGVLRRLAEVLQVHVDDLVPLPPTEDEGG